LLLNCHLALKSNDRPKGEDLTGSAVEFTKTSVTKRGAVKSALKMSDFPKHGFNLPPEQQAIRDKCFHRSGTFVEFPIEDVETSIPARFEKIVRLYPDRLAVKIGDRALTYGELNRYANRTAYAILEKRGPGSEPIALLFEHGIDAIAVIFGVLKAGKFFVALNPAFPEERNARVLEDSGAPLIVTSSRHKVLVETLGRGLSPALEIEALGESCPPDPVLHRPKADIAVLTYTSGSTGQPKGVVQTHQHLLHSFQIQTDEMRITIDDRVSLLHSLSFATAYSNLLAALLNGAALFPLDMKAVTPGGLTTWICDQNITVLHLPPTSFRQFAESIGANVQLHQLRLIRLSGAPITQGDFNLYKSCFPTGTLLNITMGSTEARGICSAILDRHFVFPSEGAPVGYGRPGKQILIVDDLGREVANGRVGEIAVISKYADAEYWHPSMRDKPLTQRTTKTDHDRIRLTGDLGKKLDDGFVIHLGRKDFMVKIRGYRVDIGEVERALLEHPLINEAGVVAWERDSGEKYLVGYVVPRQVSVLNVSEINEFLRKTLPDYMIPSTFTFLASLPLTNGKLDRAVLPRPDHKRPNLAQPYAPPRGEVETRLVQHWEEILNVRPIGIHDNFFDLGGQSLMAVRLVSDIDRKFGRGISVAMLMQAPTVAQLANFLSKQEKSALSPLITIQTNGSKPPFFCAHGTDSYLPLSRNLGPDQPFYGLAQHLEGRKVRHTAIEDIAAHYLKEVRRVQPEGPYYIGGHSIGGLIAFEMAQQLKQQKQEIALLVLLDSGLPRARPDDTDATLGDPPMLAPSALRKQIWAYRNGLKGTSQRKLKTMACEVYHCLGLSLPTSLQSYYVDQVVYGKIYSKAHRSYAPQLYAGRVVYLQSEDPRQRISGWEKLIADGLEVHPVPGDHLSMLAEFNVRKLAETLKNCLANAQESWDGPKNISARSCLNFSNRGQRHE